MQSFGLFELLLVAGVAVLLLGLRNLPSLFEGLSLGVREFRSRLEENLREERHQGFHCEGCGESLRGELRCPHCRRVTPAGAHWIGSVLFVLVLMLMSSMD